MPQPNDQRRRWLERQLAKFDEAEIATVGGRLRASIYDGSALDPYEVALEVTLVVLTARSLERQALSPLLLLLTAVA